MRTKSSKCVYSSKTAANHGRPVARGRRVRALFALLFFALVTVHLSLTTASWAQTGSASISGRVTDQSNGVIPDVEVEIKNVDTNVTQTTKTNGEGIYTFPALPPGNYLMNVRKQQFRTVSVTGLVLHTQDSLARNFVLQVGSSSVSVTVSAETTNESPAVSMTVTNEFVENMPLNGRSFQDLIQLAPGTVSATNASGYYSIDGQRQNANNFTVDGVSANTGAAAGGGSAGTDYGMSGNSPAQTALGTTQSLASVDSLQEFKIQTSGYTAEYGRNPGGQIGFTTRSGTNEIHGTLFEYFRNTAFDANSYQNNYFGYPKTAEHQNDYGGTVGGPLVIPRFYNGKDKTFFFVSYEGLKLLTPAFESEYVPTQAFRAWASPLVQPYLNASPLPNPNSPGNQDGCTIPDPSTGLPTACDALFSYGYSNPSNVYNVSVRLDQNFGQRFHVFVRYAYTPSSASSGAEAVSALTNNSHTWTAGLTANISSNLLNEFRFNYSYDVSSFLNSLKSVGGSTPTPRNLLIPAGYDSSYDFSNYSLYVPSTSLNVGFQIGGTGTALRQYQVVDSLSWAHGSHSFKFGGDWRRLAPTRTVQPYASSIGVDNLSDIQNGYATTLVTFATAPGQPVFDNLSLYAQDHWRIGHTLSIDYGLRWEFNPAPGPSNGHYPATLTSSDLATAQLAPPGTAPYETSYRHFAPRFGFAWNAIPTGKLAFTVRGGFGIFYDTGQSTIGYAYSGAYPFQATSPTQNEVPLPFTDAELVPPSLNVPLTPPYPYLQLLTSPGLTLPYTEQWNLSLDKALSARNTLTISYVGNNGKKLLFSQYYQAPGGNQDFAQGINVTSNAAQSSYNALQVQNVGRIASGLDLVGSFTWAHARDNASSDNSTFSTQWGNSDNDLPLVLNVAINYQTKPEGSSRLMRALTGGWLIANRFSAQSGYPLNVVQTYVTLINGSMALYAPDLVPGVPIYLHGSAADVGGLPVPGNWRLNQAAFAPVPVGADGNPVRQGTLGRNYVRTDGFWALNTAVQRSFRIHDRLLLNFRVEAFNVFNHPNLGFPDTGLTDSTFGQVLYGNTTTIGSSNSLYAMGAARSLQLSLKLQF